jgi:hypothetical protein
LSALLFQNIYIYYSPAPNIVSAPAASGSSNDSIAQRQISVDSSRPTTNIQIRLADGSRFVFCAVLDITRKHVSLGLTIPFDL